MTDTTPTTTTAPQQKSPPRPTVPLFNENGWRILEELHLDQVEKKWGVVLPELREKMRKQWAWEDAQ